jgi:hypothetical protein
MLDARTADLSFLHNDDDTKRMDRNEYCLKHQRRSCRRSVSCLEEFIKIYGWRTGFQFLNI